MQSVQAKHYFEEHDGSPHPYYGMVQHVTVSQIPAKADDDYEAVPEKSTANPGSHPGD